jgi:hypothetical protein
MPGHKQLINNTNSRLDVALYVRSGANPADNAGTTDVTLNPHSGSDVPYGSASDIYLNGMSVTALFNGQVTATQDFVVTRGSALDDLFNRNSIIQIDYDANGFQLSSRNT